MKKQHKILGLFSVLLLALILLVTGRVLYNNRVCKDIEIKILNPKVRLIDSTQVLSYIMQNYGGNIIGKRFKNIDEYKIVKILDNNPYIDYVQVSHSGSTMEIEVMQARPIVKIFTDKGDLFIDTKGNIMSAKPGYSPYILVANGKVKPQIKLPVSQKINIHSLDKKKNSAIFSIFAVAKYINASRFWRDFITQIYIKDSKTIILSPRFGDFIIILGDASDLDTKFWKLHTFLKHINQIGWNKYSAINLKYKNQIVCVKK